MPRWSGKSALDADFVAEFDTADESAWSQALQGFDDGNIFQAWPYGAVVSGDRNNTRLILRYKGEIAAIAQARIASIPVLKLGVAYVFWGPVWRRQMTGHSEIVFRQAIRALRNEFVCRRGLTLRLAPMLFDDDSACFSTILEEEGFSLWRAKASSRTILMDLTPDLSNLYEGMNPHWKRELKVAERKGLDIVEGTGLDLFDAFIAIYKEMVARKRFAEPNDINQFKMVQTRLPEQLKMKVLLCKSGGEVCSGLICSMIGKVAVYLFGATSNVGMKSRGSYLLQWRLLEQLKRAGVTTYDLNGIDPIKNPGTYKFKNDLSGKNGKQVRFIGRFDAHGDAFSAGCVACADAFRSSYGSLTGFINAATARRLSSSKIAN
jgi:hypothetical protein